MKIYRGGTGELVEDPDSALVAAAERALAQHRGDGRPRISFVPLQRLVGPEPDVQIVQPAYFPIFYIENPDYRTYP